nr:mediator of RNA polymerase II transcription subunit 19a-like isoform X1 [Danio rerio]|eukprot:XP_021322184.1 mediator of RNA polymerase II transcription subunit 19a-like isoform X1 [Danio rerio]
MDFDLAAAVGDEEVKKKEGKQVEGIFGKKDKDKHKSKDKHKDKDKKHKEHKDKHKDKEHKDKDKKKKDKEHKKKDGGKSSSSSCSSSDSPKTFQDHTCNQGVRKNSQNTPATAAPGRLKLKT